MLNITNHFTSPLAFSALDGVIGVTLNGIVEGYWSGYSVAGAGDVNGDGIDDMVIGAPYAYPGDIFEVGSVYLIFGHTGAWSMPLALGSLNGTNGVVINGIAAGDISGSSVASASDVNGDGIDDVLIGAGGVGSSYLIFGHAGTWNSSLALSSLNGTNGVIINGVAANYLTGCSVASAGDVNGDGISDVVIGASSASPGGFPQAGSTYLIFGHRGTWSSPLALGSLNGANGVIINGIVANDQSGWSVAGAGDVNGDSISDIVIGAHAASPGNLTNAGSTYLIFGHAGAWNSPLMLGSLNGVNGVTINGIEANDRSGTSVASAGDMNGDGIADVVIGAFGAFGYTGSTYLIFGHAGAWNSSLALGSLNGVNGVIINGIEANDRSGTSVAGAGDVNGDGIADVVIGAPYVSSGGLRTAGSTYLIFGHTGAWNSPLWLSSLNGIDGVVINGIASQGCSGSSVASAGDVNGDGISDVLIGAPYVSPGGLLSAGSAYLIFGDSLDLLVNTMTINQGQTIFLNNNMLMASHPNNLAINANIPFSITNVTHGTFSTLNFVQSALSQQLVSFTHDGTNYTPSFKVTAGNWAIVGPQAAMVSFDVPPVLYLNPFSVGQGQTVVLTNQSIRATSLYHPSDVLMFSVSNVLHGNFIQINTTATKNQFSQSVLIQGQIAFATDGSVNPPSYDISVSNARITTLAIPGIVNFNAAPILLNNQLTLTLGQQKIIVSSNDLSARDTATPLGKLIFTPSTLNCHFENINFPGAALPSFVQESVQGGQILFVWDVCNAPAYNMSVSDGILSAGRSASIIFAQNTGNTSNTEIKNPSVIIGSVISAAVGLGLLFGLQWYLKKRTKAQLQKVLLEGTSDAEKAFNVEVIRPIANKIFDVINTTECFGRRSEADTKVYMTAILKIISELSRQNANLDFNAMEPIDKELFINEIANQTRQQSLPKHKGSCGSCTRYFKVEATPQEIEYAAEGIAFVAVAWQNRHVSDAARSKRLSFELGMHNVGFSDKVANEDIPPLSPEKQLAWMRNNMQMMEQQHQQEQQEQKKLEEQIIQQEAELAFLRRQGSKALKT